jgi:hypothetical protein
MLSRFVVGAAAILASAGVVSTAHATLFSFASDTNSNSFTFAGTAGGTGANAGVFTVTDFSRPNTYLLEVDDDNGSRPTIAIPVEFRASLTARAGTSTNIVGSLWQHSYQVSGDFGFYNTMGQAMLTLSIPQASPAILTVPGSQTSWSTVGAVLGSSTFTTITYNATAAFITALGGTTAAANMGITVGNFNPPSDFGFDLSAINAGSIGQAVAIDATTKAPLSAWRSESSYSGSAGNNIPTPGSAAMIAAGTLIATRRRRA